MTDNLSRSRHEYVEARFKATEIATEKASEERVLSAEALAKQLAYQINAGDSALRDHIEQQIGQLKLMLDSTRREIEIRAGAEYAAISKSEAAYDKRFTSVNEFRAQISELVVAHQESLNKLTTTLMPRELAEARLAELEDKAARMVSRLDRTTGASEANTMHRQQSQFATSTWVAIAVGLISFIVMVVTVVSFIHAHP